jgi:hypothetical protein
MMLRHSDGKMRVGIAGGIRKRRWNDLGQLQDLRAAAAFYERGAKNAYGDDAYQMASFDRLRSRINESTKA